MTNLSKLCSKSYSNNQNIVISNNVKLIIKLKVRIGYNVQLGKSAFYNRRNDRKWKYP